MARQQKDFMFDVNLQLKDAGLVAASAAAQVASAAKILDLGASRVDGRVIIDTTAVESDTGDELYTLILEGSTSKTFASGIVTLGAQLYGHTSTTLESAVSPAVSRREIGFTNEVSGTLYEYVRMYTKVAGTIATGINYIAYVVQEA